MSVRSAAAAAGPPWRNHSFILGGGRDPPLTDQGETIIGVYLLLLGGSTLQHTHTAVLHSTEYSVFKLLL